ncbi:MAG: alpha/beta fold hydrolase [Desulfotignum sp.]|nr:alpha/beta fold hydrolase [Desulfotignum sp.]MCF8087781.1 alpha/beta fold hydrolase [Desulfotignum sp.]MCF8137009.1 alpha/beta fold hydrolase [Desulfotignum sp.]
MSQANVNGVQIEYETFGDKSSPSVLLIMGLAGQLIHWQKEFCMKLSDHGYHVIRYDNRDSGLSTKFSEVRLTEAMEKIGALFMGEKVPVPYSIEDMANDAAGLLDLLDIKQAHICGMSMGGFIAQTFAINNPNRILSLTSIYSSSGNRKEFQPTKEVMEFMLTPIPEERDAYIEYTMKYFKLISGAGLPFGEDFHRNLAAQSYDRSFCPEGVARQSLAIMTQKDRASDLENLAIPALVIHGDDDPVVPLAAGKATAEAIPNSELKIIKGMGHAIPNLQAYWSDILDAMINHMGR